MNVMTATKIKGLQIQKLQTMEPVRIIKRMNDAVVKPEGLEKMQGSKGVLGLLADFVMVGGDFV